ncbi:hypothetical protein SAMN05216464_101690 [Mucilaginibacter pineti]|uniref:Uncharacterized protein n=1 Tax=Mucilaginibacter pineti TaxID=1391627 RepID=A0A1G6UNU8_9SPHI|nr:hypothetical protein [Mucilaginibacter pineti]SDD42225.1 hypothetical protein SAMN05216464_101690 [Mucilaginibacter pineti]
MAEKSAEVQARDFVYELNNCASEYGFGKEELWEINLVSEKEKEKLEKKYYPTISALIAPEIIPVMEELVKSKLTHTDNKDLPFEEKNIAIKGTSQYLVAYSALRTL